MLYYCFWAWLSLPKVFPPWTPTKKETATVLTAVSENILSLFCSIYVFKIILQFLNPPSSECGQLDFNGLSGTIYSPNYPANYDQNNIDCRYLVLPGTGSQVLLRFNDFSIEEGFDYLEVLFVLHKLCIQWTLRYHYSKYPRKKYVQFLHIVIFQFQIILMFQNIIFCRFTTRTISKSVPGVSYLVVIQSHPHFCRPVLTWL